MRRVGMDRPCILLLLVAGLALALVPWQVSAGSEGQPARAGPAAVPDAGLPVGLAGAKGNGRPAPIAQEATRNDSYCLTCHGDATLQTHLADGKALSLYVDARALRGSAHGLLGCVTCHTDLETHPSGQMASSGLADHQARATETCVRCHLAGAGDYAGSAHAAPLVSGGDGATCNDCHSPDGSGHSIARIAGIRSPRYAESVADNCGRCHKEEMESYNRTAHSELVRFGDERRAATCTNCHGDHAVRAVDEPGRPLAPARLAEACEECHPGADEEFAGEWMGHDAAASASGVISYGGRGVVVLMAVGVASGLTHMALDFLRSPRRPGGRRR